MLAGANAKWQPSFTETLQGSDIIIIPDNDKPGQEFATKVADSLAGSANTIKVVDLTKKWKDLKEKGDITDVFEMVNNDEEVLSKLDELEKETSIYIKVQKKTKKDIEEQKEFEAEEIDLKLNIPKGYIISKKVGVTKLIKTKNGDKVIKVSPIPIVISKILKNIDTGEENVELTFFKRGKWESLIVDKNTLYNTQNIITLANKGIPINSNVAKILVSWLYDLEMENYNDLRIDRTINRFGWIDDETFLPFRSNNVQLQCEPGISSWLSLINKKKGTYEEWKNMIQNYLNDDETGLIRFILAAAFSSCLLRIVGMRGTVINLYGPSGVGKTSVIELANTIYSSPDSILSFSGTTVSIITLSERLSGIGIFIDEKQAALKNNKEIPALLYSLAEGRTRLKSTKDLDVTTNKRFETNVICSAEQPLTETSNTGAARRTMEIYTSKVFSNKKSAKKAHRLSTKFYGYAAEMFVNKLIDEHLGDKYQRIIDRYNGIEEELNNILGESVVNSYIQSVALIILADILMNETFGFGFDEESSMKLGIKILNRLQKEDEIDEVERAREIVENWLIINDSRFDRQSFSDIYDNLNNINVKGEIIENKSNSIEKYGMYQDGIYFIIPLKFNELMNSNGLSPNKIRRVFAERGYIKIDEANNRFTVSKFYNGGNRRMLAYKLENEKEREESIIEGKIEENIYSKGCIKEIHSYNEIIRLSEVDEFSDSLGIER